MAQPAMDTQLEALVRALGLALIGAAIPGVVALWQTRHKADTDARMSYYQDIREDVDDLRARLDSLEEYILDLESHVEELHAMMVKAEIEPPPRPRRPRLARGGAS